MPAQKKRNRKRTRYVPNKTVHTVSTHYYGDYDAKWLLKTNSSKYALNAALNAHKHLHKCTYWGAMLAEVFDLNTGRLYAVLKLEMTGAIHALYQDDSFQRDLLDEAQLQLQRKG